MEKQKIILGSIIIGILLFILFYLFNSLNNNLKITGKTVSDFKNDIDEPTINLFFYDNVTNCSLNGKIYVDNNFLGNSKNGFLLNKSMYKENFKENSTIWISGLTDDCFEEDKNLPFNEYWTINNLDYYFEYGENLSFITFLTPRQPKNVEEMQGFIRPYEVKERLLRISFNEEDSLLENVNRIFKSVYMNYVSDKIRFGVDEYWQTPADFIKNKGGDCEDWAIYMVSLLKAYNSSLDCYAALWLTHVNVICYIEPTFVILDQNKVEKSFILDKSLDSEKKRIAARKWRNNYFKEYNISADERRLFYLFNENEIIEFEKGKEDFINWVINKK